MEIIVFSFSICTILIYILLWNKPKDVSTSITVKASRFPTAEDLIYIAHAEPTTWPAYRRSIWISNHSFHRNSAPEETSTMNQGCMVALLIFGGVHCAAWGFVFPAPLWKLRWRVCSITTIADLPLALVHAVVVNNISWAVTRSKQRKTTERLGSIKEVGEGLISAAFVLSRLSILVEAFRSFSALLSGVYKTTWSDYVPHFG